VSTWLIVMLASWVVGLWNAKMARESGLWDRNTKREWIAALAFTGWCIGFAGWVVTGLVRAGGAL
jgi:hypothetical protein